MKVLLVNSAFGGGGITTYATQLVKCLSADTELTVILGDDKIAPINEPGVQVLYYDTKLLSLKNAFFFIELINNKLKPDVIIASAAPIIPVIAPYLDNIIKVFTVSHSGRNFHSNYCAVNHNYLDGIIAASSDYNKDYLERKFGIKDKGKIKVIYNFVADDKELEYLREEKKSHRPISIVFAGASAADKSPELVAKIVTELLKTNLDFRFYWTGNTTIPLTTTLFKHSPLKTVQQMMPKDNRLIFPGRIPDKRDYDRLLGGANIILAPSKNEGCSMALLEGHRAGCIFVVADYPNSNNEIVSRGKSGFVINHKNIDDFVQIITKIISNPSDYEYLYENSHNVFSTMLSYSVWREKIFQVLMSSANHKPRMSKASKLTLLYDMWYMRWLKKTGLLDHFLNLSLPSYISFRKQYKKE